MVNSANFRSKGPFMHLIFAFWGKHYQLHADRFPRYLILPGSTVTVLACRRFPDGSRSFQRCLTPSNLTVTQAIKLFPGALVAAKVR